MQGQLELFENPEMPSGPQHKAILDHLRAGKTLTVLEAIQLFGCYALSQRIGELIRDYHWPIKSEMIITQTGKRVAKYSLQGEKNGLD